MKNIYRAVGYALKYKYSLAGAIFCSVLVATFWGASIGVVYPFVEIVFDGKSAHQWVDESQSDATQAISEQEAIRVSLQQELDRVKGTANEEEFNRLGLELASAESNLVIERKKLVSANKMEPYIKAYLPDSAFQTLVYVIGFLLIGTTLKGLFLIGNMVLVARVGQRTVLDLQNQFFSRTLRLDLKSIGENGTGDLINRIRGETGAVGTAVTTLFGKTLREPLKMGACLAGAAYINWRLLLFSMVICPPAVFLLLKLARASKRANRRAMQDSAKLLNRLFQSLTYVKIVKAYNMEQAEQKRFDKTANDVYRRSMKIAWYTSLFRLNNELLGIGIISLSVLAGGYLVLNGETHLFGIRLCAETMNSAQILTFYAFLIGVSDPLRKLADVYNLLQAGIVSADRVFELLDRQTTIHDPVSPKNIPATASSLEFEGVSFEYQENTRVLNDVDLKIRPGESLAIVGANGSGKSTLVNLLPRFYDPLEGRILLDGTDIQNFTLGDLRKHIALVTQQTMLFDDTVCNNIRFGSNDATYEQITAASKKAHADEFITSLLDEGYETNVGEHGGRLSGGQRQRISLARAILRDPKLLILDEATSQIDPESEMLIHATLAEFIQGRTTIMITHRLSTLELADRIAVFESGRIIDLGTHHELIQRCELYQRIRQTEMKEAA